MVGLLSWLWLLPLAGALAVVLLPSRWAYLSRWATLVLTLVQLLLVVGWVLPAVGTGTLLGPTPATPMPVAFYETTPWLRLNLGSLGTLAADYALGVDGANGLLLLLHALLMPIAVGASWQEGRRPRTYFALLQLLNATVVGCFLAFDFLLFYLFFEVMLLPMFFLIGGWGGERRAYAALKFFLYTLLGSVAMLVVVVGLPFAQAGVHSTTYQALADPALRAPGAFYATPYGQQVGFVLLLIGFAIKLPAVPLHTWLPDAHVEASTPISVLLAGVLLKAGGYGLVRVAYGFFPAAGQALGFWMALVGVVGIVYGSLVALAQTDFKRLVAYSSVGHMGYVLLGAASGTALGLSGALYQLFAHGLVTAALFLLVGVVYDRVHSRQISAFGGLWQRLPRYTAVVALAFFAGLALPGTASFVAELLVLMGAFGATTDVPLWLAALALAGVVLAAVYFLWAFQRMFLGPWRVAGGADWEARLTDLSPREHLLLWPLVGLILLFGLWPALGLGPITAWVAAFFEASQTLLAP
ncbi:MAG: NADH-quinone oxidoreductase subunit M [Bacteroidia bacterium]|nr:NADH-quinone oxidoreductase subunit M [Bacteroidia bacterium]